jgi:flagellar motor switch protein FliM
VVGHRAVADSFGARDDHIAADRRRPQLGPPRRGQRRDDGPGRGRVGRDADRGRAALREGDLVRLNAPAAGGVTLYADKVPVKIAKPGRSGSRRAVQVTGGVR